MPASPPVRKEIRKRYRDKHKPQLAAYMRDYRAREKPPAAQSIDLERCEALEGRRTDRAIYNRWVAGSQVEFAFGIEEVA